MLRGAANRAALLLTRGVRLFDAVAAGAASRAELRHGIASEGDHFRQNPEEVMVGLFAWERNLLDPVLCPMDRILVVGCGTGRELFALARRGHDATGIDPSEAAVRTARDIAAAEGIPTTILHGFFEDAEIPGTFDVVFFSHRCYGLIQGRRHRIGALAKARTALNPRGRIVVCYLAGAGMHATLARLVRVSAALSGSDVRPEPGDAFYRLGASSVIAFEHQFRPGEFDEEAREAALEVRSSSAGSCPTAVAVPRDESAFSAVSPAAGGPAAGG